MYVGSILYGYCGGYFGRDSYEDKRIEVVGNDYVLARGITNGDLYFCDFNLSQISHDDLKEYLVDQDEE
jgi:hypothetical protein